ncbi:MAG: enoyl-CoA hydratase [Deltaproteobacteria bacterium]|nr:enoyl-CoA hydratase [Deltaproteobacteria bacterium]
MSFLQITKPRPGITLVTMNRPERMNAMAFDVMIPLRDALREISFDNEARVVVLTGAGEGFSSGADHNDDGIVPHIAGLTVPTIARRALKILDEVILSIRDMHQPVIGAINGAAIGGGLCLAIACDIRVASTEAYFRAAGINNGLTSAELGLSYLLPRAIGSSRAFEIMLSGRDVDAEEADRIGLVSRVVEPEALLDTCYALAERILGYSHIGVELTKQLLWASLDAGGLHAHMNHEGHAQLYVRLTTDNFEESVRARAEGRKPVFRDDRDYAHKLDPK